MNESRCVIWWCYLDPDGNKDTVTLRQDDKETDESFFERVDGWKAMLQGKGYVPLVSGGRPNPVPHEEEPTPFDGDDFEAKFDAGKLVKSVNEGKDYWKVSGIEGQFPKYPVAIWPEVIERDLCPMDKLTDASYPLDGYIAFYEKNEKGNPKKVVQLVKS